MLSILLRVHGPLRRSAQPVLVCLNRTQSTLPSTNAIDQLEKDGARILRAVQKRVDIRKELLSKVSRSRIRPFLPCLILRKMSESMSAPEDIARARQAKELEPLHDAWTLWVKTREVR